MGGPLSWLQLEETRRTLQEGCLLFPVSLRAVPATWIYTLFQHTKEAIARNTLQTQYLSRKQCCLFSVFDLVLCRHATCSHFMFWLLQGHGCEIALPTVHGFSTRQEQSRSHPNAAGTCGPGVLCSWAVLFQPSRSSHQFCCGHSSAVLVSWW
jgi:hypothetical protein